MNIVLGIIIGFILSLGMLTLAIETAPSRKVSAPMQCVIEIKDGVNIKHEFHVPCRRES